MTVSLSIKLYRQMYKVILQCSTNMFDVYTTKAIFFLTCKGAFVYYANGLSYLFIYVVCPSLYLSTILVIKPSQNLLEGSGLPCTRCLLNLEIYLYPI